MEGQRQQNKGLIFDPPRDGETLLVRDGWLWRRNEQGVYWRYKQA
jgi:hypothetical protein